MNRRPSSALGALWARARRWVELGYHDLLDEVASHPDADADLLAWIAENTADLSALLAVARHEATSPETLGELMFCDGPMMRVVALTARRRLAQSPDPYWRLASQLTQAGVVTSMEELSHTLSAVLEQE